MDMVLYSLLNKKINKIVTGDVSISKTGEGDLIITANEGKSSVTYTKEELMGLGIKSIDRDNNGDAIITYTNNTKQNIGQWNGKNATINVVEDTELKYVLKLSYHDKDNKLIEITTPNLKANKGRVELETDTNYKTILQYVETNEDGVDSVKWTSDNIHAKVQEIKPNEKNTLNSFKVDIDTYDEDGNKTTVTSDELMPEKYLIQQNENNTEYIKKIDIIKIKNDGTQEIKTSDNLKSPVYDFQPKSTNNKYDYRVNIIKNDENGETIKTTANLKGNEIWEGKDLIGDEIVFEVVGDDGNNYSRVNDLYINTDTNNIYRRTDKDNVNNLWEKVGNIQGKEGNDAYEVAVEEGFKGTRQEWLKSLMGESLGSQIVWNKPILSDENTMLKVWYYYKVDSAEYGQGSAWLNRYNIPSDVKDYKPGKYSFYNGINYLNFETTIQEIPALTEKDKYNFYVLYDEKESRCLGHVINKETGEDTPLGNWVAVTKSSTLPEGSELVAPHGEIIQYGKWVQTIYIGNSKDNAYDCTISTGVDMTGFITTEEFETSIGSDDLKTDSTKVRSAINEIFDMIKANKNTVLETTNKALFEAVNELYKKKYVDCFELKDEDLLAHCLNLQYKTLSCNFIYCENCTNVPKGNNGYGYAMLIISQDTHYRQVVFFDPSNGKISTNNIGDNADKTGFGNWSGWNSAGDNGVPIGSIQAYYGRAMGLSIPDGWKLCNGSTILDTESPLYGKNLPDMRQRVLAMAPIESFVGATTGSNNFKLNRNQLPNETMEISGSTTYTPSGTVSVYSSGSHNHDITVPDNTTGNPDGATDTSSSSETKRRYWRYPRSGSTSSSGYHSHNAVFSGTTATLNLSGSVNLNGGVAQQAIDNMQATMYVDYIMKIK